MAENKMPEIYSDEEYEQAITAYMAAQASLTEAAQWANEKGDALKRQVMAQLAAQGRGEGFEFLGEPSWGGTIPRYRVIGVVIDSWGSRDGRPAFRAVIRKLRKDGEFSEHTNPSTVSLLKVLRVAPAPKRERGE